MGAGKVLAGLILILIGLGLFADSVRPIIGTAEFIPGDWLINFVVVLTGVIPIFLILIGIFVVWLEMDEIKAERELRKAEAEEKKEEAEKKEKAKKK